MASTSTSVKDMVDESLKGLAKELRQVNHQIWSNPETAFKEHKAHDTICDFLESQGFEVTRHAYGLDTSFEARSGQGGRLVSFNAEYDALPNIGHACGHNLIATSSLAAFLALSYALKKLNVPGRAQLLGTPAEEGGGGKVELLKSGAYKDVGVTLMAHPASSKSSGTIGKALAGIGGVPMLARERMFCQFKGRNAHAGANPWDGINALDAFVASYNGISMLRQQTVGTDRIHCAITDAPKAANIIPASTKAIFSTRADTVASLKALSARVVKCVQAGALATGCEVVIESEPYYADVLLNDALCGQWKSHMAEYGQDVLAVVPQMITASSDIGNVSYEMPTLHANFNIPAPEGISPHHASFASAAGTDEAHDIAVMIGKSLALVGLDVLTDETLYKAITAEWQDKVPGPVSHL
ncbi:hypothetical protein A1O1_03998 [Capronia coronata CBS 617.96]|uniref:Peptidase M20 domain-containing protein 2 n=1 Tax=Capronia coronata CBS 617.96 TaxID=1182541 RepID=W9YDG0_9EURO|nr:uncharacterized protein A1O1_03998 [Capronia coronata CBS 617.96]EXJ90892.1 hypothetical protein A1O1_03998 [Capronia coronata CBS 617.96]